MSYLYANQLKKQIQQTSSKGWRSKGLNQKTSYINQIPLSNALERFPQFFDDIKISVVQKSINSIDRLPYKYNAIEILYLSNNNLTDLDGIQQFKKLKTLTLAHNELSNVRILRQISQLQSLECLNLTGNPIAKHPNYKIYLLTVLPNLKILDGKFSSKIDLHREMITKNNRFAKNITEMKEISQQSFKNIYDFQNTLDEQTQNELQDMLLNDILTLFESFQQTNGENSNEEDNYDRAFQEMIRQQNQKLAQIDVSLDKKLSSYHGFLIDFIQKFNPVVLNNKKLQFSPGRSIVVQETQQKQQNNSRLVFKSSGDKLKSSLKNNRTGQTPDKTSARSGGQIKSKNQQILNNLDEERDLYQKLNSGNQDNFNRQQNNILNSPNNHNEILSQIQQQEEQDILLGKKQNNNNNNNVYQLQQQHQNNFLQRNLSAENILYQRNGSSSQNQNAIPRDRFYSPTSTENLNRKNFNQQDHSNILDHVLNESKPEQQESRDNSPNRTIPQPSQYEIRPNHQDECCRKLMKSAKSSQEMFNSKITPYKRKNKDLEEMVYDLTKKLNQKDEENKQMKQINENIKNKLIEINSKSENYTMKSQQEQLDLMNQLQNNKEANAILDQECKDLRNELNKLLIKNHQLGDAEKTSHYYQQQQKDTQLLYDQLQYEVRTNEIADSFNNYRIQRRGLLYLFFATKIQKQIHQFRYNKNNERNKELVRKCFGSLKKQTLLKKYIRITKQQETIISQQNHFSIWKRNVIFQSDVKRMIQKREQSQLALSFLGWKQFIAIKERNQSEKAKIQSFRLQQLRIKSWRILKQNYRKSVLSKKEFDIQNQKAITFDNSKTKRKFLKYWKQYIINYAIPYKQNQQNAQKLQNNYLMKLGFAMLVKNRKEQINNNIKVNKFIQYKKKKILRNVFNFFSGIFITLAREKAERQKIANLFIKKRLVNTWKQSYQISRNLKRLEEKARQFSLKKLVQRHFNALNDLRQLNKRRALLAKAVKTKIQNQQKRISILKWFKLSITKKSERLDRINKQNELQRAYFKQWLLFVQQKVQKKQKQRQILNIADKKEKLLLSSAFTSWIYINKRKLRNRGVVENMLAKRDTYLKRIALYQLSKEQKLGLFKQLLQLKNNQSLLKADFKENQIYLESIDEEKCEIADKSRELMQQNVLLQEHISEKNSEINQLKRQVQNLEKVEQSQEEVIKDLQQKVSEQEMQICEINNEYVNQMDEEENNQKNMRINNKQLIREITQLQKELELRNNQISEYEKRYQNNTSEILGNNRELQEKLQNSILMGNEFRDKIEEQDRVIANLEDKIIELNDTSLKQKEHISDCVAVIQQFETTYDSKVAEYENIINQLNAQIEENRILTEEQTNYIESLTQENKKLEYEVNLLTENHQANTNQFISSLYRSGQKNEKIISSSTGFNGILNSGNGQMLNHSICSEADLFTLRKRNNYMTSPLQLDQNRRTTSKDYKLLQKSFERQRTQMKDKIQSLTKQIHTTLQSQGQQGYDEQQAQPQQENNTNNRQSGTYSNHNNTNMGYYPKMNQSSLLQSYAKPLKTSTAAFFTERRPINTDKSYEEYPVKQQQQQQIGQGSWQSIKQIVDRSGQNSLKVTPKVHKFKNSNSIGGGIGLGLNTQPNFSMNQPNFSMNQGNFSTMNQQTSNNNLQGLRNDLNFITTPSYNFTANHYQPLNIRPDSAKESRNGKSSVNDLSTINNTDNILQELERSKSGRKIMKSQLEIRIKNLNDNLEQDINNSKKQIIS